MTVGSQSASFWYLPSQSSQKHLSAEDLRRAFYQTTNDAELRGKQIPTESRGENMIDVYNIGRKDSKYMRYQIKRAPLIDRNSCQYNWDYTAMPLNGLSTTKAIARESKSKSQNAGAASRAFKFGGHVSRYKEEFKGFTGEQTAEARPGSARPPAGRSAMPKGDLQENVSHEQETFKQLPKDAWCKGSKVSAPMNHLQVGNSTPQQNNTLYRDTYVVPDSEFLRRRARVRSSSQGSRRQSLRDEKKGGRSSITLGSRPVSAVERRK